MINLITSPKTKTVNRRPLSKITIKHLSTSLESIVSMRLCEKAFATPDAGAQLTDLPVIILT